MSNNDHTHICKVCDEPISDDETVEVVCRHTRPETVETTQTLADGPEPSSEQSAPVPTDRDLSDKQQQLLDDMLWVERKIGRSPTLDDMQRFGGINSTEFYQNFGTFNEAKGIVGLDKYGNGDHHPEPIDGVLADGGERDDQITFTELADQSDDNEITIDTSC